MAAHRFRGFLSSAGPDSLYWTLLAVVAAFVFVYFVAHSGLGLWPPESLHAALTWSAPRPYAYRVLLPLIGNLLGPALGGSISHVLATGYESILGERLFLVQLDGAAYPAQVAVILTLMCLSMVGFGISIWYILWDLGYSQEVRYLHPPALMIGSLLFFRGFGNFYDLPLLFLFSLGLYLMHRQSWTWYMLVFGLGTLNKETTIVLLIIFAAYYFPRLKRPQFFRLAAWQIGLFAFLQGIVRYALRANPGGTLESHLGGQLATAAAIVTRPAYLAAWAAAIVVLAVMILRGWQRKPLFVRWTVSIIPLFLTAALFWSTPLELRGMLEVYPVLGLLLLPPPPSRG
jgi:hypothetical protein